MGINTSVLPKVMQLKITLETNVLSLSSLLNLSLFLITQWKNVSRSPSMP